MVDVRERAGGQIGLRDGDPQRGIRVHVERHDERPAVVNFAAFLAFGVHGLAQHGLAVLAERADGAKRREVGLDLHLERGRGVVVALSSVAHRPRRYVLPGVSDSVRWLMVSPLYGVSCSPSFAAYSPETTASVWFSSDFGRRVAPPASLFFVLSTLPSVHGDAAAHVFLVIGRVRISVGDFEALHCDVFGVLQQDGLADARTGDDGRGAFAVRSDGDGRVLGAFGVDDAGRS